VDVNPLRADHLPTSALCKPHWWQERLRSAPTTKCVLAAALLILPALGAPVHADDPIAQWLKQDGSDGQNDQIRPDLHALTNQQLQDIFKIGRDQADGHQLIEGGSEERPRVLYIWVAAIAAGFGMAIGAIQVSHYLSCRRLCRTIIATADTSYKPPSAPADIQSSRTS